MEEKFNAWMADRGLRIAGTNADLAVCDDCGGARQMAAQQTLDAGGVAISPGVNPFLFAVTSVMRTLESNDGRFACGECLMLTAREA